MVSYSWRNKSDHQHQIGVLILIVVDNGLVQLEKAVDRVKQDVLILIVVDNGLVHENLLSLADFEES